MLEDSCLNVPYPPFWIFFPACAHNNCFGIAIDKFNKGVTSVFFITPTLKGEARAGKRWKTVFLVNSQDRYLGVGLVHQVGQKARIPLFHISAKCKSGTYSSSNLRTGNSYELHFFFKKSLLGIGHVRFIIGTHTLRSKLARKPEFRFFTYRQMPVRDLFLVESQDWK